MTIQEMLRATSGHDFYEEPGCDLCCDTNTALKTYYGQTLCQACIDIEENTDWDKFEEDRRRRILESHENERAETETP